MFQPHSAVILGVALEPCAYPTGPDWGPQTMDDLQDTTEHALDHIDSPDIDAESPSATGSEEQLEGRLAALESQLQKLTVITQREDERLSQMASAETQTDRLSLVLYSGTLDKLLAGMNIATGAAAMGAEVHLFFTFWATAALRAGSFAGKRPLLERMFGWMLPSGMERTKLSTMNMGGLGTKMMKRRMKSKNVTDLGELFDMAKEMGVCIHVCDLSMDLLGMTPDDLIDYPDMDYCGVATFLSLAMESETSLFI